MTEFQFNLLQNTTMLAIAATFVMVCVADARVRRIPNLLVLVGLSIALLYHATAPEGLGLFDRYTGGGLGLQSAAFGALICFTVFLVLYVIKVMGAGDAKLMAFVGAIFGAHQAPTLIVAVFLCGGGLALLRMFNGERRARVVTNLRLIVLDRMVAPAGGAAIFDPEKDTADRMPFALAICAASLLIAASQYLGMSLPWALPG